MKHPQRIPPSIIPRAQGITGAVGPASRPASHDLEKRQKRTFSEAPPSDEKSSAAPAELCATGRPGPDQGRFTMDEGFPAKPRPPHTLVRAHGTCARRTARPLAHAAARLRARPLVRARRPHMARGSPARQPARRRSSSTCYRAPPPPAPSRTSTFFRTCRRMPARARHAVHPLVRSSARAAPRAPRGSPTRACRPRAPRIIARRLHRRSRPLHRRRTRRRSRRRSKSPRSQRTAPTGRWPRCS